MPCEVHVVNQDARLNNKYADFMNHFESWKYSVATDVPIRGLQLFCEQSLMQHTAIKQQDSSQPGELSHGKAMTHE